MNQWVTLIATLLLTLIIALVGWINAYFRRDRKKTTVDQVVVDTLATHEKNFVNIDERFRNIDAMNREHANYWRATELRMAEFTQMQKDMSTLRSDFRDVCRKIEESEDKRDKREEKMEEKFDEIKDTLHRFEVTLTKLSK